jgi:uncharacterized protein (DUF2062 family)
LRVAAGGLDARKDREQMLFRRRVKPSLGERVKIMMWPRRSWSRSMRYFALRLWRLDASPHSIAIGFAAGVFAIVTPFLGLQMILAATLAMLLRGSVVASAIGSFAGNPITYPMIWISTYQLGTFILGGGGSATRLHFEEKAMAVWNGLRRFSFDAISAAVQAFWPILKPMAVGALPIGLAAAVVSYVAVRRLAEAARNVRRARFKLKMASAAEW